MKRLLAYPVLAASVAALCLPAYVSMARRIAALERRAADNTRLEGNTRPSGVNPTSIRLARVDGRLAKLEQRLAGKAVEPVVPAATPPTEAPAAAPFTDGASLEDIASNFELYDADGDGRLEPAEVSAHHDELQDLDLNDDRRVGRDEADRLLELMDNARAHAKRFDAADGVFPIGRHDYVGSGQQFSFLDRDADGLVTEGEYVSSLAQAVKQLRRFDLDYDGALTVAEMWDAPTRFSATDLDGDSLVYAWEVLSRMERGKW